MKKHLAFFLLILGLAAQTAQASVRSIYLDQSRLFLLEKIAAAENLLDNPAQLAGIKAYLLETDLNLGLHNTSPYDAVYKKTLIDESLDFYCGLK